MKFLNRIKAIWSRLFLAAVFVAPALFQLSETFPDVKKGGWPRLFLFYVIICAVVAWGFWSNRKRKRDIDKTEL